MAGSAFPITKDALDKHAQEVDMAITSIRTGGPERGNLADLVKSLKMDTELVAANDALTRGFELYYELYDQLQARIVTEKIDGEISEGEKRAFMSSYSAFGAASFIRNKMSRVLQGEPMEMFSVPKDFTFDFSQTRNDVLNQMLAIYYGISKHRKGKDLVTNGQQLVQSSIEYFKFVQDNALQLKPKTHKKLVDLVASSDFRVMDDFTLSGFDAKLEEKASISLMDFTSVEPHEVAGNVWAKKEMFRDMDRAGLYDPILQKNPVGEVGGLSWSVIYIGLPGTGKSTLFLAGYTRIRKRCEQVTEFWKQKNFKKMYFTIISVDPKVKDKMYGGTAGKMAAADEQTADPTRLNFGQIDDIDLLMEGDRDSSKGGADNDILNGLMQILGGVDLTKRKRGNTQWWAATNAPTKMDPALLQRFSARYEVDGPQTWYDFADILRNKLGGWLKPGMQIIQVPLGEGYTPFEMRKGETGLEIATPQEQQYVEEAMKQFKHGIKTFKDIGLVCELFKKRNPRFTGRAVDSVTEAVKKRINDYDIPETWFVNPNEFLAQSWDERVGILRSMCKPVDAEMMAKEVIRYARIEENFAEAKFKSDVQKLVYDARVRAEASRQWGEMQGGGQK